MNATYIPVQHVCANHKQNQQSMKICNFKICAIINKSATNAATVLLALVEAHTSSGMNVTNNFFRVKPFIREVLVQ